MQTPTQDPCPMWRTALQDRCLLVCAMILIACCWLSALMGLTVR